MSVKILNYSDTQFERLIAEAGGPRDTWEAYSEMEDAYEHQAKILRAAAEVYEVCQMRCHIVLARASAAVASA